MTVATQTLEGQLTDDQRETLNAAEEIIKAHFQSKEEVLMFSFHGGWQNLSVTYFTPNRVQHTSLWCGKDGDNTLAGKLAYALALRFDEEGRADQIKADRVEKLKAELAALEQAA